MSDLGVQAMLLFHASAGQVMECDPETKATLDDMRVNDKPRWHALVRQCRTTKNLDEVGVPDLHARQKAVVKATL